MSTMRGFEAAGCGEKVKLNRRPMIGGVPERIWDLCQATGTGNQLIRITETSRNEASRM